MLAFKIAAAVFLVLGAIPAAVASFYAIVDDTDMARSMTFFPLLLAGPLWLISAECWIAYLFTRT